MPVGDDGYFPVRLAGDTVEKGSEHRSVNAVNHNTPREVTADMTLTRKRFPATCTVGMRPFGAQE